MIAVEIGGRYYNIRASDIQLKIPTTKRLAILQILSDTFKMLRLIHEIQWVLDESGVGRTRLQINCLGATLICDLLRARMCNIWPNSEGTQSWSRHRIMSGWSCQISNIGTWDVIDSTVWKTARSKELRIWNVTKATSSMMDKLKTYEWKYHLVEEKKGQ